MGKAKKKVRKVHTNHHDNPRHKSSGIVRRSHSQRVSKKSGSPKLQGHQAASKAVVRPRVPFNESDHVLCVGEGDFSFALSLAACHNVKHLVATCYDDHETLHKKYPQAQQIILQLLSVDPAYIKLPLREEDSEWRGLSPSPSDVDASLPSTSNARTALETIQSQDIIPQHTLRCVHYAINATKLSSSHSRLLRTRSPFTKIVFNFPHVGGLSTDVNRQVRANQELLVGFFKAAMPLLASPERPLQTKQGHSEDSDQDYDNADGDDGEGSLSEPSSENTERTIVTKGQIMVTLFEGEPYTLWNIRDLARHSGLKVAESFRFPWEAYPGYAHARTVGAITRGKDRSAGGKRKGAWRGEERDARCFVLEVNEEERRVDRSNVGTDANKVDLGTRKGRKKMIRGGVHSDSESD